MDKNELAREIIGALYIDSYDYPEAGDWHICINHPDFQGNNDELDSPDGLIWLVKMLNKSED